MAIGLREHFIWASLARVNPSLPPTRRPETKERWATAISLCARWAWFAWDRCECWHRPEEAEEWRKRAANWAAETFLTTGKPCFPPDGDGLDEFYAGRIDGVTEAALRKLAECVLGQVNPNSNFPHPPTLQQWTAWRTLYPNTADLGSDLIDDPDREERQRIQAAVDEWEDFWTPGAIYWWQVKAPSDDAIEFWRIAGLYNLPYRGPMYRGPGEVPLPAGKLITQLVVSDDGAVTADFEPGRNAVWEFKTLLMQFQPHWEVAVNTDLRYSEHLETAQGAAAEVAAHFGLSSPRLPAEEPAEPAIA